MSIENDINQRKFRNEYQKAAINLIYTYNWANEQIKQFLEQHDITAQQFNILRILRGAGEPLSTLQIRQRMLDKMSDTSRIVDRLLKKALVKKNYLQIRSQAGGCYHWRKRLEAVGENGCVPG